MQTLAILSNCQTAGLANAVRSLAPDLRVTEIHVSQAATTGQRAAVTRSLRQADMVWCMPLAERYGTLAESKIAKTLDNVLILPVMLFFGFHPDLTYLPEQARAVHSPLDEYHSTIVIASYLSGLDVHETTRMFNSLVYAKLGYTQAYERDLTAVVQTFANYRLDVGHCISRWRDRGCFMHSPNHPKSYVLDDLARLMLHASGLATAPDGDSDSQDTLECHAQFPVYPELARRVGVPGSLLFKQAARQGETPQTISLRHFVEGSFAGYARVPTQVLRKATGVERALREVFA